MIKRVLLIIGLLSLISLSHAATALYTFDTSQKQQQFYSLTEQLRCLVCQNETIAASNAPLAIDLRKQVYTMVQKGETDQAIKDYLVARYGDFILFKPPVNHQTLLLWWAPLGLLLFGLFILWRVIRKYKCGSRAPHSL